jgi:hypothetical protein
MADIYLSEENDLALAAATLLQPDSSRAWEKLLKLVEFEDLNDSILRIAPAIYSNLSSNTNISSYSKLKGSYRYNWAKNSKMFTGIYPVLKNLNQKNINYRLLKGTAINLLHNSMGIRVMGDFDLLIYASDLIVVQEILYKNEFLLKYYTTCQNAPNGFIGTELTFINSNNVEIDLHVAERAYPQLLFRTMLKDLPRQNRFLDTLALTPSYELCLIHAAIHGSQGVGSTDEIQSILDCAQLVKYVDISKLAKVNKRLDTNYVVYLYLKKVASVSNTQINLKKIKKFLLFSRINGYVFKIKNRFLEGSQLYNTIILRRINKQELLFVLENFNGKKLMYFLWLKYGQLRPIELVVNKFFKGFLSAPETEIQAGSNATWSNKIEKSWVNFTNCPVEANDWRFKVINSNSGKKHLIQLYSESFKNWNWVVFLNGRLIGTTPKNSEGVYSIFIETKSKYLEFSLRSPMHVCKLCHHSLQDLNLIVRY